MRTYGRVYHEDGSYTWTEVQTDANGLNDYVRLTALIQELKLNLNESPFWANRGIPAHPSVINQVAPDYYTMLMQQRHAAYFTTLTISRVSDTSQGKGLYAPTYRVVAVTNYGVQVEMEVPV